MLDFTPPGCTTTTSTPKGFASIRNTSDSMCTALLVAQYAAANGVGRTPTTLPTLTIRPERCWAMRGNTACVAASRPMTFVSKTARTSSSFISIRGPKKLMPALLTSTSIRPARSITESTAAAMEPGSFTSSRSVSMPSAARSAIASSFRAVASGR